MLGRYSNVNKEEGIMVKEERAESGVSRRQFVRGTAAGAAALQFPFVSKGMSAAADGAIRVGLIGCGGRGTGAALNVLQATTKVIYPPPRTGYHTENAVPGALAKAENVRVVALADLLGHRLEECRRQLKSVGNEVSDGNCFTGFDAYEKLLGLSEVNYVILATPPQFRPRELKAAVEAGKHVFMEKPIAVDAEGVRSVVESGKAAERKGLGVCAGTQRRHSLDQVETVRRLRDGAIGKIIEARAYFNVGEIWAIPREAGWSDLEWQYRNWPYFTWLSGDIIVEQHIHTLDLANWVLGEHPVRAYGVGGRASHEPGGEFGHTWDHFAVEYEYPSGARLFSQNRQIANCTVRMAAAVVGEKGTSNCENRIVTDREWRYEGPMSDPYEQEHMDLIESIRRGKPINETKNVAEATMTAILGREAAYSGKVLEWEAVYNSKRDYTPARYEFGAAAMPAVVNPATYRFY